MLSWLSPLLLIAATPAQPISMVPAAKWLVDFADARCVATRTYGTGDQATTLVLKPSPLGNVMQVGLAQPGNRDAAAQVPAKLRVSGGEPIKVNALAYGTKAGEQRMVLYSINLPVQTFAPLRQAAELTFDIRNGPNVTLALSQMTEVTEAIDRCLEDLQNVWNVGESRAARLTQAAKSKRALGSIFSDDDYPDIALYNDQSGKTGYVLLIDERGALADCTVDQTSGVASLDSQTCYVLKTRGRFEPAIGLDGKPAKGTIVGRVVFNIDTDSDPHRAP